MIAEALVALREKELLALTGSSNGSHDDAVREMLNFVQKNRTVLQGSSSWQVFPLSVQWFRSCGSYEVGNGLLMAYRRKRITQDQIDEFLTRLRALPIVATVTSSNDRS